MTEVERDQVVPEKWLQLNEITRGLGWTGPTVIIKRGKRTQPRAVAAVERRLRKLPGDVMRRKGPHHQGPYIYKPSAVATIRDELVELIRNATNREVDANSPAVEIGAHAPDDPLRDETAELRARVEEVEAENGRVKEMIADRTQALDRLANQLESLAREIRQA